MIKAPLTPPASLLVLAGKPVLLTLLLALLLWPVLNNSVLALFVAALLAVLVAMLRRLIAPPLFATRDTPMPTPPYTLLSPALPIPTGLPSPDAHAQAHTQAVQRHLHQQIQAAGGFLPFSQWMQHALYTPGLGYYAAGARKFGAQGGDFTTAPELTPLFGRALATQVHQILAESGALHVLEVGAGSGALAASVIPALRDLGLEPHYHILEVSSDLRARQQTHLAPLQARVQWLDHLPEHFSGCVLANEVLDAMPTTLFRWDAAGNLMEIGVVTNAETIIDNAPAHADAFAFAERPAAQTLHDTITTRLPVLPGYRSECNLQGEAWVRQLGACLHQGAVLLIDYGFPQREYYHPQRAEGTLMCHLRHYAHAHPLIFPGLQDITAHVDFTAMADAALAGGLDVLGYTTQARFMLNCGLLSLLEDATAPEANTAQQVRTQSAVQTLISEAEMGELFKVLAVGRGIATPLLGFRAGDRRHRL